MESSPPPLPSDLPTSLRQVWESIQKNSSPAPEDKPLELFVGDWRVRAEQDLLAIGPQTVAIGEAESRLILGGKTAEFRGFTNLEGMTYLFSLLLTFDRYHRCYRLIQHDNFAGTVVEFRGDWDGTKKQFVMEGMVLNPEGLLAARIRFRRVDDDHLLFELQVRQGSSGRLTTVQQVQFNRLQA